MWHATARAAQWLHRRWRLRRGRSRPRSSRGRSKPRQQRRSNSVSWTTARRISWRYSRGSFSRPSCGFRTSAVSGRVVRLCHRTDWGAVEGGGAPRSAHSLETTRMRCPKRFRCVSFHRPCRRLWILLCDHHCVAQVQGTADCQGTPVGKRVTEGRHRRHTWLAGACRLD